MHYLIAGGGDFGTRYLRKLNIARKRRNLPIESITVIDNNPNCKAKKFVEKIPCAQIEVADLLEFGNAIWLRRNELKNATWVPAPIAPHIFADWMKDKLEKEYKVKLTPLVYSWDHVKLPFIKALPDGRLLLSHAPGMCPINCTEPADCAITKGPRWWEMKNTIKEITTNLPQEKSIDYVAMLFGEHHYGVDGYGVGGIPMNSIYNELDKLSAVARTGKGRIGVATTSSCHAVVTLFEIQNLEAVMTQLNNGQKRGNVESYL